jgi:hypothetical protein
MSAVRGPTDLPKGGWIVSRFGAALSVAGFGGIGISLAGGTTTCASRLREAAKKKTPTAKPRRAQRPGAARWLSLLSRERTR